MANPLFDIKLCNIHPLDPDCTLSRIARKADCTQEQLFFISTKHPHLPSWENNTMYLIQPYETYFMYTRTWNPLLCTIYITSFIYITTPTQHQHCKIIYKAFQPHSSALQHYSSTLYNIIHWHPLALQHHSSTLYNIIHWHYNLIHWHYNIIH